MMGYRGPGQVVEVRMSVGRLLEGVSGESLSSVCLLMCEFFAYECFWENRPRRESS